MKTAIVGLGVMGRVHAEILTAQNKNIVAVCDVNEQKLNAFSNYKGYSDYLTMLNEEKPDVVHICTPHYLHAEMVIEALKRGVNVICEKPLCIGMEELSKIIEVEKKSKAILGVCHQNRYNDANLFVKDYLKDKDINGGYGVVVWKREKGYYRNSNWRGKWQTEGGGVLINQALHTLDIMQWLLGMPTQVCATCSNFHLKEIIEVEDSVIATFFGDCGFNFSATTSGCFDFPVEVTVYAGGEVIKIFNNQVIINGSKIDFEKSDKIYEKSCYGVGHENLIADFYNCVNSGEKFWINGEEAGKVIKLILSTYKSNGKKIDILEN